MAEQIQLDLDLNAIKKELNDLKAGLASLGEEGRKAFDKMKKSGVDAADNIGDAFDVSVGQGIADALGDLQKDFKDLERAASTLRGALSRSTDPDLIKEYAKGIANLERGMLELRTAANKAGVSVDGLNKKAKEMNTAREVAEGFFGSFAKAAIIVSAVQAVVSFTKESFNLARQVAKTERQFAGFVGGIDKSRAAIASFNKAAAEVKIPEIEFQQAAKSLLGFGFTAKQAESSLKTIANVAKGSGKDFNELALIFGKARASGVLFAEDINQLSEAGIPIVEQFAIQLGVGTDEVKKLASEGKIGFSELELALTTLTQSGTLYAGQAVANADASDQLSASWQKLKTQAGELLAPAINSVVTALNDIVVSASAIIKSDGLAQYFRNALDFVVQLTPATKILRDQLNKLLPKQADDLADQRAEDAARNADEQLFQIQQNAAKEREKLGAKTAKAEAEKRKQEAEKRAKEQREFEQLRINALRDGLEKDVAQENLRFKVLESELRKAHINTEQSEDQHQKNLNAIRLKYYLIDINEQAKDVQDEIELRKRSDQQIEQLDEEQRAARRKRLAEDEEQRAARRKRLAESVEFTEQASELTKEVFNQQQLANRAKFFEIKRSDKEIKNFEAQAEKAGKVLELEIQKRKINNVLFFNKELTDVERQTLETRLAVIDATISQIAGKGKGKGKDGEENRLLKLLGIDPEDPKFQAALDKAIGAISSTLNQIVDLRIEAAQQEVDIQTRKISDLEATLETEKERAANGFANDVKITEDQLALARSAQDRAIADKKKAQKQELAIDTATQLSNTAVAVTNIIKGFSKFPVIGLLLGIAQVAALFGFLQSARARNKAINAAQFRDGGEASITKDNVLAGPSHEGGGIGIEAEGGEAVFSNGKKLAIVSRKMTRKHFDLVRAINADNVPKMKAIIDDMIQGRGNFNHGHASDTGVKGGAGTDTRRLEYLQSKNNMLTKETTKAVTDKPVVFTKNGRTVIVKGNRQTTI